MTSLARAGCTAEACAEIIRKADGLPLFAEEITRAALETGADSSGAPAAQSVPASLHASLMARLDRLGPAKEVAQIAAVIGGECAHALLALAAAGVVGDLDGALDDLVAAGLFIRRGQPPDAIYFFKHALLQDLAYSALLRERKRALHARIAEAMETRFPEIGENQPETLARHCAEAGAPEKAAALWARAGRLSLRKSALKEAETHFARALDLIRAQPTAASLRREEITCQIGLARTLLLLRGYTSEEAKAALNKTFALLERARALGEPVEHPLALFITLHGFWLASVVASSGSVTRKLAAECLALAEKGGAKGEIVAGRHAVGLSKLFSGDPQGSLAHFDQAIAIFDPAEDRRTTRYGGEYWSSALAGRAAALWMLGKPDAARADATASLQSARAFGHAMTLGNNLVFAAWIQFACGHMAIAGAHAADLKALADEKGEPFYRAFSLMMEGLVAIADGGAEDAVAQTSAALVAYRATGATLLSPQVLAYLAKALAKGGRFADARRCMDDAIATIAATEERWCEFGHFAHRRRDRAPVAAARPRGGGAPFRAGAGDCAGPRSGVVGASRGHEFGASPARRRKAREGLRPARGRLPRVRGRP